MKEKNKTKIIIAIIAAFGLIIPSCIDLEKNQENNSPKNIETDSSDEYHSETTDIKKYHYNTSEDVVEDESDDNSYSNNSENTSGNVFQDVYVEGDLTVKQEVPHEEKKNYEENVVLTGELRKSVMYGKNNEIIDTYYDDTNIPICDLQMRNGNIESIGIKNIYVEVMDCNVFNEDISDIPPKDWASIEKKIFWSCNISPELREYQSILIGYDENNTEDLSNTQYVQLVSNDTGQFNLVIHPSLPGEYKTNIIVEYISYNNENKEVVLSDINFTYNPYISDESESEFIPAE